MHYLILLLAFLPLAVWAQESGPENHLLDHSVMHQERLVVPQGMATPQLALRLSKDATDGFNLHIELRNFLMESPDFKSAGPESMIRGHAHLYLNGVKLTRVYAGDLHLPARLFRSGINSLQVSINDHNHAVWAIGQEPIQATILMNPALEQFQMSHYSSSPIQP